VLDKNKAIIEGAILVARQTAAGAVILAAALPEERDMLQGALGPYTRILTTRNAGPATATREREVLILPEVRLRRRGRAKIALLEGLAAGYLEPGERVVVISGNETNGACELDTVAVVELDDDEDFLDIGEDAPLSILRDVADPATFDAVLGLCVELGREGKEGKAVGLLITLGDDGAVLGRSRQLVLNPFEGHGDDDRCVLFPAARRALAEFSGMDGAFVIRRDGVIMAAGRYLQEQPPVDAVPSGLGARHSAAAGITASTRCVAFAVSESTGDTRVFGGGRLLMTIQKHD
jgi:DNA integrity scanning protein DisA with diadenylate cyclase activity